MSKKNKGQSLLEVLIALSVIILVITALVRVVTLSIRSTDYSRNTSVAATYAIDGMEKIRSFRDSMSWTNFTALATFSNVPKFITGSTTSNDYNTKSCPDPIVKGNFTDGNSSNLIENTFFRCSLLTSTGTLPDNNIKATITVYWLENNEVKNSVNVSYFYNWK